MVWICYALANKTISYWDVIKHSDTEVEPLSNQMMKKRNDILYFLDRRLQIKKKKVQNNPHSNGSEQYGHRWFNKMTLDKHTCTHISLFFQLGLPRTVIFNHQLASMKKFQNAGSSNTPLAINAASIHILVHEITIH